MNLFHIKSKLYPYARLALALIFPPRCPACDKVTGSLIEGELCKDCRRAFDENYVSVCPSCKSKPEHCGCVPDTVGSDSDRSPYTEVLPLSFSGYYTGYDESVISTLVFKLKRQRLSDASFLFARIIAQSLLRNLALRGLDPKEFTVTFIPRSESSIEKYYFDHMQRVAKHISHMIGCKYDSFFVRKGGTDQKELSAADRNENAFGSLSVNERKRSRIRGAKVIILDDIVTSGASMRAAVSKLSFAGASVIIPACTLLSVKNKDK